ncbi:unnamed protein product [Gordionus sp. m RMFG-2023]
MRNNVLPFESFKRLNSETYQMTDSSTASNSSIIFNSSNHSIESNKDISPLAHPTSYHIQELYKKYTDLDEKKIDPINNNKYREEEINFSDMITYDFNSKSELEREKYTKNGKDQGFYIEKFDRELDMIEDLIKTDYEIKCFPGDDISNNFQSSASCPDYILTKNSDCSEKYRHYDNINYGGKDRVKKNNHNRVERARRDNINYRIKELASLLPTSILADIKHNKGTILKASVNYIKECQNYEEKIKSLEERQKGLEQLCTNLLKKLQVIEKGQFPLPE